ncbi:MAG: DUF2851 family protein [Kiritimatiellia bacterium]
MRPRVALSAFFPLARKYRTLVGSPADHLLRENGENLSNFPYSERHIQCVWYDPRWRPQLLRTSANEPVLIEHPGRWNLEAGPDFLDARLVVGTEHRRLRGDVEVHIRPRDWLDHDHDRNPAYSRVVAHVTYFQGTVPPDRLPAGAVQIALAEGLRSNPTFSFESVDLTAYPYAPLPRSLTPCAAALAAFPPDEKGAILEAAGQERLRSKAERFALAIRTVGPEQVLYEETMSALGYKHNRHQFRCLAKLVPIAELQETASGNPLKAYALLAGVAELLPATTAAAWDAETRLFVRKLWDHWWKLRSKWTGVFTMPLHWHLSGVRPGNHPARRLAAAALLFTLFDKLPQRLEKILRQQPSRWLLSLTSLFRAEDELKYWEHHYTLGGQRQTVATGLVGEHRMAAILTNVILPFLAAQGTDISKFLTGLPPEEDTIVLRQTAHALFGRDHARSLYSSGLRQQGLIQIFHDFCLSARIGCASCPFPAALNPSRID